MIVIRVRSEPDQFDNLHGGDGVADQFTTVEFNLHRLYDGRVIRGRAILVGSHIFNGAERNIAQLFPHLAAHNPGVIGYTATRWTALLRRPRSWPKDWRVPTAGECYRFVLSDPHVHTVLTAPRNAKELRENIAAVRKGPLDAEDLKFMREFGDAVYRRKKWFM